MHRRLTVVSCGLFACAFLIGCSTTFSSPANNLVTQGAAIHGSAFGGQQLLTHAKVYLYAAGSTGYGSASTSLLNKTLAAVSTDAAGNGYVVTDSSGSFSITSDWSCVSPSDTLYLLVTGGNPGLAAGTDNSAIALMAMLGTCSNVNGTTFAVVNEITTVVAATTMQQFAVDGTHIGSGAYTTGVVMGIPMANAIAPVQVGLAGTGFPGGIGRVPQTKLNTFANVIAACVNTASPASAQCTTLFAAAKPPSGAQPADTFVAALDMAKYPVNNVAALFALSTPTPAFQPALTAAPSDWLIGVTYGLGSIALPGALAIEADTVMVSNRASDKVPAGTDSVLQFSSIGLPSLQNQYLLSFTAGGTVNKPKEIAIFNQGFFLANTPGSVISYHFLDYGVSRYNGGEFAVTIGGLSSPTGLLALDSSLLVSNSGNGTIAIVDEKHDVLSTTLAPPGFIGPGGISGCNKNGYFFTAGKGSNSVVAVDKTGTIVSGPGAGITGGGINAPTSVACDNHGRVFVSNSSPAQGVSTISAFSSVDGSAIPGGSNYGAGTAGRQTMAAVDGYDTLWSASCGPRCVGGTSVDNILHMSATGVVLSPAGGFTHPDLDAPSSIAIDDAGNLWIANTAGEGSSTAGTVTALLGVAGPVKTPFTQTTLNGLLGTLP